jgi:Pyruvate/2-oxoacid:ferredoxin oxidoreductase delta subunit
LLMLLLFLREEYMVWATVRKLRHLNKRFQWKVVKKVWVRNKPWGCEECWLWFSLNSLSVSERKEERSKPSAIVLGIGRKSQHYRKVASLWQLASPKHFGPHSMSYYFTLKTLPKKIKCRFRKS